MIGAIIGDMIGSPYQNDSIKTLAFPLTVAAFTGDTVLTIAVAQAILTDTDVGLALQKFARQYPHLSYGGSFWHWIWDPQRISYYSYGNGSAARAVPVGFAFSSVDEVLEQARRTAMVSHNHPQGIIGAQAVAQAVFLARTGKDKSYIRKTIEASFTYDLERSVAQIRPDYTFDLSCQGSVPEAIIAFLDARDYESAIRNAVSLGGDAGSMACIAGGIAQAYYKDIPVNLIHQLRERLPAPLLTVVDRFNEQFGCKY